MQYSIGVVFFFFTFEIAHLQTIGRAERSRKMLLQTDEKNKSSNFVVVVLLIEKGKMALFNQYKTTASMKRSTHEIETIKQN